MNKSDSINELAAALAKAQGVMTAAKMDAINPFLHNKYADLGSVIQAARKPLSDNGLSFSQHPSVADNAVTMTTLLMHASGQWIESYITLPLEDIKGLSLAQSMGKVITYMRRYGLSSILGIYADEDTDGNDGKTEKRKATEQPSAPGNGKQADKPATTTNEQSATDDFNPNTDSKGKLFADMDIPELAGHLTEYEKRKKADPNDQANLAKYAAAKAIFDSKRPKIDGQH